MGDIGPDRLSARYLREIAEILPHLQASGQLGPETMQSLWDAARSAQTGMVSPQRARDLLDTFRNIYAVSQNPQYAGMFSQLFSDAVDIGSQSRQDLASRSANLGGDRQREHVERNLPALIQAFNQNPEKAEASLNKDVTDPAAALNASINPFMKGDGSYMEEAGDVTIADRLRLMDNAAAMYDALGNTEAAHDMRGSRNFASLMSNLTTPGGPLAEYLTGTPSGIKPMDALLGDETIAQQTAGQGVGPASMWNPYAMLQRELINRPVGHYLLGDIQDPQDVEDSFINVDTNMPPFIQEMQRQAQMDRRFGTQDYRGVPVEQLPPELQQRLQDLEQAGLDPDQVEHIKGELLKGEMGVDESMIREQAVSGSLLRPQDAADQVRMNQWIADKAKQGAKWTGGKTLNAAGKALKATGRAALSPVQSARGIHNAAGNAIDSARSTAGNAIDSARSAAGNLASTASTATGRRQLAHAAGGAAKDMARVAGRNLWPGAKIMGRALGPAASIYFGYEGAKPMAKEQYRRVLEAGGSEQAANMAYMGTMAGNMGATEIAAPVVANNAWKTGGGLAKWLGNTQRGAQVLNAVRSAMPFMQSAAPATNAALSAGRANALRSVGQGLKGGAQGFLPMMWALNSADDLGDAAGLSSLYWGGTPEQKQQALAYTNANTDRMLQEHAQKGTLGKAFSGVMDPTSTGRMLEQASRQAGEAQQNLAGTLSGNSVRNMMRWQERQQGRMSPEQAQAYARAARTSGYDINELSKALADDGGRWYNLGWGGDSYSQRGSDAYGLLGADNQERWQNIYRDIQSGHLPGATASDLFNISVDRTASPEIQAQQALQGMYQGMRDAGMEEQQLRSMGAPRLTPAGQRNLGGTPTQPTAPTQPSPQAANEFKPRVAMKPKAPKTTVQSGSTVWNKAVKPKMDFARTLGNA